MAIGLSFGPIVTLPQQQQKQLQQDRSLAAEAWLPFLVLLPILLQLLLQLSKAAGTCVCNSMA
jgi:hypothetical protein